MPKRKPYEMSELTKIAEREKRGLGTGNMRGSKIVDDEIKKSDRYKKIYDYYAKQDEEIQKALDEKAKKREEEEKRGYKKY